MIDKKLLKEAYKYKYDNLDLGIMENRFTIMSILEQDEGKKKLLKEIAGKIKTLKKEI